MGISVNGPSGIDTKSIIDSLVSIEQEKVTKVENAKAADQVKIDAYSKVKSLLSDIQTKAATLSKSSSFDLFKTTSSNDAAVTVTGGAGSVDGRYSLKVFQLAQNEKMISKDGKISSQTATLSSLGVTPGVIQIDGVNITIDDNDSIQDLRMKINSATNTKGEKIGVSASVVKISDTNYRMVLSAKNTGASGVSYSDISGSTLQDLGIITDATGSKGNVKQSLTSKESISNIFDNLSTGDSIQFTGTDHNGTGVTNTFIKSSDSTIDDFLKKVEDSFSGTISATVNGSGNLVLEDQTAGTSSLAMTTLTTTSQNTGTNSLSMTTSAIGNEGAGVLSSGKDSYFSVEDIDMHNSSNTVTGVMTGVTFELKNTSIDKPVTVTLQRDSDAIQKNFQALIDSFNALANYSKSSTGYKDPNNANSQDGDLAGDSTLPSIVSQIRSQIKQEFGLFGTSGKYTNLTMFGLQTDVTNGQFTIDSTAFKKGVDTHFDDMLNIFTTLGVSENTSVMLGRNTSDTTSGKYQLEQVDSDHLRIRLDNSTDWYTSDARVGDIVTFSDGPAKGLSLTAPDGVIGPQGNTFTFSKGLSANLDQAISKLDDTHDGLITLRQDSWRKAMASKDERIATLNTQVQQYRDRLTKQYAAMEQAMSDLTSQASKVINAFSSSK